MNFIWRPQSFPVFALPEIKGQRLTGIVLQMPNPFSNWVSIVVACWHGIVCSNMLKQCFRILTWVDVLCDCKRLHFLHAVRHTGWVRLPCLQRLCIKRSACAHNILQPGALHFFTSICTWFAQCISAPASCVFCSCKVRVHDWARSQLCITEVGGSCPTSSKLQRCRLGTAKRVAQADLR